VAAGVEHADVLVALHRQCFEECWSVNAMAGTLDMPGTFGFIACRAADPAGFVLCRGAGGESEVLALGVTPSCRLRRIGTTLLSAALAQAKSFGGARMILEVAIDNGAARRLYASAGFVAVGQRRSYYTRVHGPRIDALILERDLTGPSRFADPHAMD
jgi:[ribosomal protein S18]-alanine N-acetyltransferase